MKKLINTPETVVTQALAGIAAAHPSLSVDIENKVILRAAGPRPGKVGLVSGGGSGHEPLHGGFVGYGMLDAACPGEVFTSPVPDQMFAATKAVDAGAGVLHVVTMVDALAAATQAFSKAIAAGASQDDALAVLAEAASAGAIATISMQALKGRASYLGPRSVGHEDPGAASTALILAALRDAARVPR